MCGFIAGQSREAWNPLKIKESLQLLNHRGPDSSSFSIVNQQMLAHTRLSIVGLNNGKQPLYFNGIHAVVNGEFYEFERIRTDLENKGFVFQTQTDSEILLYLYILHGTNCLQFLHGEFSFVLYDQYKDIWFCARDRFGIRPLNFIQNSDYLLFASEAKAFMPFIKLSLDQDSLWFSQHFQYLPQDRTLFKNVHCVKPAHYLIVKNKILTQHCYWAPPENITADSIQNATEKISFLLDEAVKKRVPKEVKACTHLSGGIDSSSISALAYQYGIEDCFTISFTEDGFYDESSFAQKTAQHINTKLNIVPVNFQDIIQVIPKAIYHAEGLSINGHLGGKYLLNKAIHEAGFKVALSGEGADEIFMGYSHLKQDFLSKNSLSSMEQNYLAGVQLPSGKTFNLEDIKNKLGFIPTWIQAKSSMAYKLSNLWTEEFKREDPNSWFINNMDIGQYSNLKQSSFLWSRYCLSGYILKVLDDAQAMAFSVEGRLPFLDTHLVEYVYSLPDNYYFSGNIEKNILRQIMQHKLPSQIVHKTKQSFMSPPLTRALQNKRSFNQIRDILNNKFFLQQDIYQVDKLEQQLKDWQIESMPESEPILMTMLSIASLCQEFQL